MTIFTPNIVISKSYEFMNKFMAGAKLSDISSDAINDSLVFLNKQNRYVYSLEHNHNFGQSDMGITLKIVDTDGDFENQFLNETFYEKLMATKIDDYLKSNLPGREFNNYFASLIGGKLKLYITYGVGDDLNNWADPLVCTLVAANIDVANNGLRKYTYRFQPIPNNLFIAPPKKDENDPNTDDYLNLGMVNISTASYLDLDDPSNVTLNVKNILTKFCQKVTHTQIGNVIVVLPDMDSNYELWCKENTASGYDGLIYGYQKVFKSIRAEKFPGGTVLDAMELNLTKAKTSFIDYLHEQERKNLDAVKKAKEKLPQKQKEVDKAVELMKQKKSIESRINKVLEKLDSLSYQDPEYQRYTDEYESLLRAEKLTNDLQKVSEFTSKRDKEEIEEEISKKTKSSKFVGGVKSLATSLLSKIPNSIKTQAVKIPDTARLCMISQEDGQGKEGEPKIPAVRLAILKAFEGINSILFDDNIVPVMTYESNMRWLKLFKEAGIIDNDQLPCFIVGDRELIMHYLYGRKYTKKLDDLNYSMSPKDPLTSIITDKSYGDKLRALIFRNKTNSSFSESLAVDELSLNNEISNKALVEFKKFSEGTDNPIFINNFRNSNVLSYSFKNSENYYSIMSQAVRDNRLKYLYKSLDDNKKNELLRKFGINPLPGTRTPLEIAKDFFSKGFKFLGEDKNLALKKIPTSQVSITEGTLAKGTKWTDLDSELTSRFIVDDGGANVPNGTPITITNKLKGLVLSHSNEGVSYLNLAIQSEIKEVGYYVKPVDLAAVSELIILLNLSDDEAEDTSLSIVPGITMPGTGFILSRIHEATKRFSTEMSLKTLPFFHMSGFYDINKRCAFFSKRNQFMGRSLDNITFDFFSGEYLITGFRHVITTGECYSEFLLTKFGTQDDMNVTRKLKTAQQIKKDAKEAQAEELRRILELNSDIDVKR